MKLPNYRNELGEASEFCHDHLSMTLGTRIYHYDCRRFCSGIQRYPEVGIQSETFHIPPVSRPQQTVLLAELMSDSEWRVTRRGAFEEIKEVKHQRRKERTSPTNQSCPAPDICCPHINRLFRVKLGLINSLGAHLTNGPLRS